MKRASQYLGIAAIVILFGATTVFAIAGIGFGGGIDLLGKIDGVEDEKLSISTIDTFVQNFGISQLDSIYGELSPKFNRDEIKSLINIGGKGYIDALPFIDFEAAINVAAMKYDFTAEYVDPASISTFDPLNPSLAMQTISKTVGFFRLSGDLTVRRTVIGLPPVVKLLKIYVGAGPSFVWCTPMVDKKMVNEILTEFVETALDAGGTPSVDPAVVGKKIVERAEESKVKVGGHLMFGLQIKPPVIPVGIFGDGKLYFGMPTEGGTPGTGFLLMGGLILGI
jgi:hypothetical protein